MNETKAEKKGLYVFTLFEKLEYRIAMAPVACGISNAQENRPVTLSVVFPKPPG
jgi:hypothetical protein